MGVPKSLARLFRNAGAIDFARLPRLDVLMRSLPIALVGALILCTFWTREAAGGSIETDADASSEEAAPWTSLAANDAEELFHFVIVADRTGGERRGVFPAAMPKINLLEPAFVVSVGDLIEGYTEDQAQIDREWDEFEQFVDALETPFFYTVGNHDMSNAVMAETWQRRFGPSYYRFMYKDVLFLILNSELFGMVSDPESAVPGPWTQAEQLAFIERTLAAHPDPRWTIVIIHQPLWDYGSGVRGDWPRVEEMLGERDYTVFAGHFHRYVKHVRNDRKYITLATTGGISGMRGPIYGEFDHIAWVTMTDDGPRIANLLLDGIHDENVVTAASRAVVQALTSAVVSLPMVGQGDHFEHGAVAFRLRNPGDAELRVSPLAQSGPDLRVSGGLEELVLAPGEQRRIEVRLEANTPVAYGALAPGRVTWSMQTVSDGRPLLVQSKSALLPVAPLPLPSGVAPTVDGNLTDWETLPFVVDRQGDIDSPTAATDDVSYRFGVLEAAGDLYFGISVTDDAIDAAEDESPRYQDHVRITVDARPDPERSENFPLFEAMRAGHLEQIAHDYMTLVDAREDKVIAFLKDARAAVEWRTARTAQGYDAEAKVSGAFLDAVRGERWDTLRIGVAVADFDPDETTSVYLNWQPWRMGSAPVAASGTFVRTDAASHHPPSEPD